MRKKIEWCKRTYRSKFFKTVRKMLKKLKKPAYRKAVKKAISRIIGECDTYQSISLFFENIHKYGFMTYAKMLFIPKEERVSYYRKNKNQDKVIEEEREVELIASQNFSLTRDRSSEGLSLSEKLKNLSMKNIKCGVAF